MTTPEHDLPEPSTLLPAPVHVPLQGGQLRVGNPGNKGGRGRTAVRTIRRASRDLDAELARLKALATGSRRVTCPKCQHEFQPPATAHMDARTRIAYAALLASIRDSGKGEEDPPVGIVVTTGSASEVAALVDGERDAARAAGERPAAENAARDPAMGPPDVPLSSSSPE